MKKWYTETNLYQADPTRQLEQRPVNWKADHLWAEYLDEDGDVAMSTDLVFEFYWGQFMQLHVRLLSGYGIDPEQAQEMIHRHFNTLTIIFEYA